MSDPGDKSLSVAEHYCPVCEASFAEHISECPTDGTRLVRLAGTAEDELVGQRLDDRYTLAEPIGSGGMGTVYRALQHAIGREVAIKVINPRLCRDRTVTKRFLREATLASRLSNKTTVTVLDFGQSEAGQLYLVMELLEGNTLKDVLEREGRLPLPRAIDIITQVCEALESAAEIEVVHRDLKPSNIMLVDELRGRDTVKVLDFGLAKSLIEEDSTTVTQSDALLGTPAYMSPDLAIGAAVDARSDLYSLGVILYQMIAGRLPFEGATFELLIHQHATFTPPPIERPLPEALRALITRLLEKKPEDRFQSAAELHDTLRAIDVSGESSMPAGPVSPLPVSALAPTLDRRVASGGALQSTLTARRTPVGVDAPPPGAELTSGLVARWGRPLFAVLALALIVAVGAVGYSLLVSGDDDDATAILADAQVTVEPTIPANAMDAAPGRTLDAAPAGATDGAVIAAEVVVRFESRPRGATVTIAGERIGKTPVTRAFAADNSRLEVLFSRRGYRPHRKSLILDGRSDSATIQATLRKQRQPEVRRRVDAGEDFIDP